MAKSGGLGDRLLVAGYDLSGDIGSLDSAHGGPAAMDVTDITQSAISRLGGLRDGGMEFTSYFDPAANASHARFSSLPRTDVIATYLRGTTLGNTAASCSAKQISYDGTRGADGSFTFKVQAQANGYGLEWGTQLTAGLRTDTGATNGTSVDFGTGSTLFGAQAYIQITAFSGTDATLLIQTSTDNGAGDAFAEPGSGFSHVVVGGSVPYAVRISSGVTTIERYVRVATVTTGGFSSLIFSVMVVRNDTSVVF